VRTTEVVVNEDETLAGLATTPSYRYAEVVGSRLFVSGQVPHDSDAEIVGVGDPRAQAVRCLKNLETLLGVHDFVVGDIRRLTIYVVGEQQDLVDAWAAVTTWFARDVPPATLLGVHLLGHTDQLVEIDADIVKGNEP